LTAKIEASVEMDDKCWKQLEGKQRMMAE